ncbi:MAG: pyridoxal phosphate-dependent aminotransferase [bacterium]|nr:pyridoxal phosphate-dependent aminotransferase [bacterium]
MKLAARTTRIEASPTLAISAKAAQMKKQGIPVIDFGVGEPDFDTPENIKQAGIKAIQDGFTKYTPAAGLPALKEAICEKLKKENGLEYTPAQIIVSCGAKHVLYNIMIALLEAGDDALLPAPYWVTFPEQIKLADANVIVINTEEKNDFKITPDQLKQAITPKTKLLILNSPSNPTGCVYTKKELEAIADICVKNNIVVVSDECYEKIVYDGVEQVSIATLGKEIYDLTIVVNAVSKTYSMTGWRIGFAAGPTDVIKAMSEIQSHATSNPTTFAQIGAIEAYKGPQDSVKMMVAEFDKRRKLLVDGLNSIPGVSCRVPKGAFYAFPNVSGLYGKTFNGKKITNSLELSAYLLDVAQIAVVPGSAFGADNYLRFSYATATKNVIEGVERMKKAVAF